MCVFLGGEKMWNLRERARIHGEEELPVRRFLFWDSILHLFVVTLLLNLINREIHSQMPFHTLKTEKLLIMIRINQRDLRGNFKGS